MHSTREYNQLCQHFRQSGSIVFHKVVYLRFTCGLGSSGSFPGTSGFWDYGLGLLPVRVFGSKSMLFRVHYATGGLFGDFRGSAVSLRVFSSTSGSLFT